ncbi:MAG: asparagine synthase (glutamine-hydrolyzing), partial [Desulfobacterales bacterium]|nr:asparagine synthase (glutamine-hydrolyzing) [Desulfobacterales bacterium]
MCGIAGILSFKGISVPFQNIQLMTRVLRHRGPDDEGFAFFYPGENSTFLYGGNDTPENVYGSNLAYTPNQSYSGQMHEDATIAFGHRRLSIIDLSPTGHQPMCTQDRRYWIDYNGEIYNYIELRDELIKEGYTFQSESDTEVLLYAYVHWGVKALERLVGMFAFVIYDMVKNTLFLARDFFGIKPLYYTFWPGGFAFASEIKALLCLPNIKRIANPQKVYDYLRFGMTDHGEETLFSNIYQLPAAHYLLISTDKDKIGKPVQYWDIDLNRKLDISFDEAALMVRELFLKNIKLHLRSDVPVGAALSGGIDSSAIVTSACMLQKSSVDLHAFSYISDDPEVSEEKWVDMIEQETGISVHKTYPSPNELINDLESLIFLQDEPFRTISIYAQYRVMRLSRETGIKVMMDGQGADELLAGYPGFWGARLASLIYNYQLLKVFNFLIYHNYSCIENLLAGLIKTGTFFLPVSLNGFAHKAIKEDLVPTWLENKWFHERGVKFKSLDMKSSLNIFRKELYKSMMQGLLPLLLRYEDRNSMANSIESRVPFLTPELVSFIFSLPEEYIIDYRGTSKAVFRSAMQGIVPDSILDRRDKIGFRTPDFLWMKKLNSWVEKILIGDTIRNLPVFNQDKLIREWRRIIDGTSSYNSQVWRWINFIK